MVTAAIDFKFVANNQAIGVLLRGPQGPAYRHIQDIAIEVENESKRLCSNVLVNVRTGRLRSSITHRMGVANDEVTAFVGSNVEYAPHVHEDRPFLTRALESII